MYCKCGKNECCVCRFIHKMKNKNLNNKGVK